MERSSWFTPRFLCFLLGMLVFALALLFRFNILAIDATESTCTIQSLKRETSHERNSLPFRYLVHTNDCGTLRIADHSLRWGTEKSREVFDALQVHETYRFTITGKLDNPYGVHPKIIDYEPSTGS